MLRKRLAALARELGPFSRQLLLYGVLGRRGKRVARARHPQKPRSRPRAISDPSLTETWTELIGRYFPDRTDLLEYTIAWSRRPQRRTLASCNVTRKLVRVALELKREDCAQWLPPLLYHELCHAVLGDNVGKRGSKRAWHGKEFRTLERRHPQMEALDSWISSGGWRSVVRSHRAKRAASARWKSK